ncbi:MAG: hypothetical protein EOO22_03705 [Comamonadaceae bacterium]|nr:MAG: hypothetical protein EOO22_03705 [Comamonadaceae bacterium]
MIRRIPEVFVVALIWYFFGFMWAGITLAAWAMFELLGFWVKSTSADIEQLRAELRFVREELDRFKNHGTNTAH